jgi:hypothetical protein
MPDTKYETVNISLDEVEELGNKLLPLMRDAGMFSSPATSYALVGAALAFIASSVGTVENFEYTISELRRFFEEQVEGIKENWDDEGRKLARETANSTRH